MIYPIVKYGHPVLEQRGADITEFDTPELRQLIEDMFESMYAAKGVGLAAPQIGIGKRLAVIDTTTGEDEGQKIVLINPEIVKMEGSQKSEEGCLSLPTFREQVASRPNAQPTCHCQCEIYRLTPYLDHQMFAARVNVGLRDRLQQ